MDLAEAKCQRTCTLHPVCSTCHRSTNAFALTQVVPLNRLPLDTLSLALLHSLSLSLSLTLSHSLTLPYSLTLLVSNSLSLLLCPSFPPLLRTHVLALLPTLLPSLSITFSVFSSVCVCLSLSVSSACLCLATCPCLATCSCLATCRWCVHVPQEWGRSR